MTFVTVLVSGFRTVIPHARDRSVCFLDTLRINGLRENPDMSADKTDICRDIQTGQTGQQPYGVVRCPVSGPDNHA